MTIYQYCEIYIYCISRSKRNATLLPYTTVPLRPHRSSECVYCFAYRMVAQKNWGFFTGRESVLPLGSLALGDKARIEVAAQAQRIGENLARWAGSMRRKIGHGAVRQGSSGRVAIEKPLRTAPVDSDKRVY